MEPSPPAPEQFSLEAVRRRRAELREAMGSLEQTLAAPAPGRMEAWAQRVRDALGELSDDFREHIDTTEGPDGLYHGVLAAAPRLSNAVARLTREHSQIRVLIDDLVACVSEPAMDDADQVRDLGTALLARLVRHRQRGSDLVYEAYEADIGGET
jgi:Hemerythrin HHE cation binding domain